MPRENGFENKRVVIIGGSSGIGLAVAEEVASQGADVVIASSKPERVQEAIQSIGGNVRGEAVDVSDEKAVESFFTNLGTFDHLVFTAGDSLQLHELADTDLKQARRAFELRYWSALATVKYGSPQIRKGGSIDGGRRPQKFPDELKRNREKRTRETARLILMFSGRLASPAIATKCKQDSLDADEVQVESGGKTMLQVASIVPATKSKTEVRALGAMERLFWLMDQEHPAHLTVTAEVKGFTKVQNWRAALDAVQRRHPVLSTSIKRNAEGQPALYEVDAAPIPLRVVDGSVQGRWELELDREMAVPFTPEQAPLIRSVLIHKPQSALLIMIAHHAIADGMALVFLIRDLLQVLSGGQIEALSFSSSAEALLSKLPKEEKIGKAEASQGDAPQAEPALYREGDGLAPRVAARKLDEDLTAALKERARREGTTVQGALCAALVLAGRKTSSIWRKQSVRVISPINVRAHLGAGEACGLYLVGGMVPFPPGDSRAFWELARFAKKELSPSQTFQSLSTSLHGLEAIMTKDMDVETAAQIAAVAFARDLMVSNLGQMPYESEFGKLKLEAVWGPTALQGLDGEQNVGIATTNGAIRLLHASYSLIPYLLENTELILRAACEDTTSDRKMLSCYALPVPGLLPSSIVE